MALKVLVSDAIAAEGMEYLAQASGIEVTDGSAWSRTELLERIGEYHGLVVRSATRVDSELIEAAHNLRVVGRAGVGVDNVDLAAATNAVSLSSTRRRGTRFRRPNTPWRCSWRWRARSRRPTSPWPGMANGSGDASWESNSLARPWA